MQTKIPVCAFCQRDDLSADELVEHVAQMLEDIGILQALIMVHGQKHGRQRYFEVGGVAHLKMEVTNANEA